MYKNRICLIIFTIFLIGSPSVFAGYSAEVVKVWDGDSFALRRDGDRQWVEVRMLGIDAPEKKQPFGPEGRKFLEELILNKKVTIEVRVNDFHKREVVRVWLDGEDINLIMLESGHAWHNRIFKRDQTTEEQRVYSSAERGAREKKLGLWVDQNPEPPWEFRWRNRKN